MKSFSAKFYKILQRADIKVWEIQVKNELPAFMGK
jgi:hypothetical protein